MSMKATKMKHFVLIELNSSDSAKETDPPSFILEFLEYLTRLMKLYTTNMQRFTSPTVFINIYSISNSQ